MAPDSVILIDQHLAVLGTERPAGGGNSKSRCWTTDGGFLKISHFHMNMCGSSAFSKLEGSVEVNPDRLQPHQGRGQNALQHNAFQCGKEIKMKTLLI